MSRYHLCCDDYKNVIFKGFSYLQNEEEFVDLTIAAEGHLVKVHKNVMAVASPYIKGLLKAAPCSSPVIFLNNVKQIILQYIIEYIYQGEVDIPEEYIDEFVQVGKNLHINGINTFPTRTPLIHHKPNTDHRPVKPVKSVSSTGVAAHIRIKNVNNKQSLEVQQFQQNETPMPCHSHTEFGSKNIVNNRTELEISSEDEDDHDLQTGDDFQTGNDFEAGTSLETGNIEPHLNLETANIESVSNLKTGNTEADKGLHTGTIILTSNEQEIADDIKINNETQINDIQPIIIPIQENTHENHNTEIVTDYAIQVQPLDPNSVSQELISDLNTELNNVDVNDLKGMSQYSITERGALQLILNRYIYCCQFESRRGHRRRWRCVDYRRSHCPAFVETDDGLIVKRKGIHSHSFHDKKIYKKHEKGLVFSSIDGVKDYISKEN